MAKIEGMFCGTALLAAVYLVGWLLNRVAAALRFARRQRDLDRLHAELDSQGKYAAQHNGEYTVFPDLWEKYRQR